MHDGEKFRAMSNATGGILSQTDNLRQFVVQDSSFSTFFS